jgi:hypothetical protein
MTAMTMTAYALAACVAACLAGGVAAAQPASPPASGHATATAPEATPSSAQTETGPPADAIGDALEKAMAATSKGVDTVVTVDANGGRHLLISNAPVPDTPENRARYGQPLSNGGRRTQPAGD